MKDEFETINNDGTSVENSDLTDNYNDNINLNDTRNKDNYNDEKEEYNVFGENSSGSKKSLNLKILIIPLILVLVIIGVVICFISFSNRYTIKNKTISIRIDELQAIEISAKDKVKQKLTYSSDDEKIATVDKDGNITGVGIGTTIIYVGVNGKKSDKVTVVVATNKEPLAFKQNNVVLNKDETFHLELTKILPSDVFEWSSNNNNVATVDSNGVITGVHGGTATIMVRESDGRSVSAKVTVNSDEILISSIAVPEATIAIGEKFVLVPNIFPTNALKILSWESSKENVAAVDQNGIVIGISEGTTTITVTTHNGKVARTKVTVDKKLPAAIAITGCKSSMSVKQKISLGTILAPTTATSSIKWSTSNSNVATVSGGTVTAKKKGTVVITATTKNGKSASCTIKVKK